MGSHSEEHLNSLECVNRSDLFPRAKLIADDPSLQVPFPVICGESAEYLGRSSEGIVTQTNFRFLICYRKSFINIPLRLIESVEVRDIFTLVLHCKDATTVRCQFSTNDDCQRWYKRVLERTGPPQDLNGIFAFAFHSHGTELYQNQSLMAQPGLSACDSSSKLCEPLDEKYTYSFDREVSRMKFDTSIKKAWRILQSNENFSLCPTYPRYHIVPATISDDFVRSVASFRSGRRFPSVVWRDQRNGAVLVRCSQPELGWLGWRNAEDEAYAKSIPEACVLDRGTENGQTLQEEVTGEEFGTDKVKGQCRVAPKKMLVIDCRSYSAAIANRAKGGGVESADYYTNCEIQFMNLANIHTIRKSHQALRQLVSSYPDQTNWLSGLEATKWLHHIGAIIRASLIVVSAIDGESRPVLIHCSDGWDRTAQVSALAQLLLDPHYRTSQGFQWLVEREWLEFGHKFADRCGHAVGGGDGNEQAPVFLQWLDCVYQVTRQFPCAFQFNEAFLVKLVQHTYSCLFGTFLFNTCQEREKEKLANPTSSVWKLLHQDNYKFHNPLYCPTRDKHVLYPDFGMHRLVLWNSVYLSNNSLKTSSAEEFASLAEQVLTPDDTPGTLQKTRSCDNLSTALGLQDSSTILGRRLSDPNITSGVADHVAMLTKEIEFSQTKYFEGDSEDDIGKEKYISDSEVIYCATNSVECSSEIPQQIVIQTQLKDVQTKEEVKHCDNEDCCKDTVLHRMCDDLASEKDQIVEDNPLQIESSALVDGNGNEISENFIPVQNGHACSSNDGLIQETDHDIVEENPCRFRGDSLNQAMMDGRKAFQVALHNSSKTIYDIYQPTKSVQEECQLIPLGGINRNSIESSTDTLTESDHFDEVLQLKYRRRYKSESCKTVFNQNGTLHSATKDCFGAEVDSENFESLLDKRSMGQLPPLKLLMNQSTSISTSTTDISDSCIVHSNGISLDMLHRTADLGSYMRRNCNLAMCKLIRNLPSSSSEASPSTCSSAATPVNSHTPTTNSSPTPCSEGKNSESPLCRQLNSVGRHLDCDGLTTFIDPALDRVQQMKEDYLDRISELDYCLDILTNKLHQLTPSGNGAGRAIIDQVLN